MKRYRRGSLTVEAALICPLFIIVMLFFVYTIILFQRAALVQAEVVSQARTSSAGYSLVASGKNVDEVSDIVIPRIYKPDYIPVNIIQKAVIRPFVGVNSISDDDEDPIVYVTPKGSVYHYDMACSYIKVKSYKVSYGNITYRRNKSGGKYKACEVCCRNNKKEFGDVYITDYGDRFHCKADCTRIKHEIITIRLSGVSHMRACSKCGKGR